MNWYMIALSKNLRALFKQDSFIFQIWDSAIHTSISCMQGPVVIMGVAGCGKSTVGQALSKRLGWTFIEGDDYHPESNIQKMSAGVGLDDEDRAGWLLVLGQCLQAQGQNSVMSCSALKKAYRDALRSSAPNVRFVHLTLSKQDAAKRLQFRAGHYFQPSLIDSQFADLEEPVQESGVIQLNANWGIDVLVQSVISSFEA